MVKICRKHSGNDRRMRAPRHIIDPFDEAYSVRAHRSRARSLRVFSSSPHMHTSDERSNQRKPRGLSAGQQTSRAAARRPHGRPRSIHHARCGRCELSDHSECPITALPSTNLPNRVRVSRDPQMFFRCNSQDTRGGRPPARRRPLRATRSLRARHC